MHCVCGLPGLWCVAGLSAEQTGRAVSRGSASSLLPSVHRRSTTAGEEGGSIGSILVPQDRLAASLQHPLCCAGRTLVVLPPFHRVSFPHRLLVLGAGQHCQSSRACIRGWIYFVLRLGQSLWSWRWRALGCQPWPLPRAPAGCLDGGLVPPTSELCSSRAGSSRGWLVLTVAIPSRAVLCCVTPTSLPDVHPWMRSGLHSWQECHCGDSCSQCNSHQGGLSWAPCSRQGSSLVLRAEAAGAVPSTSGFGGHRGPVAAIPFPLLSQ